jgi:hypothetical protein
MTLAVIILGLQPSYAAAKSTSVKFTSLPKISALKAIRLLNRQRAENGIPADLVEEPRLSRGCFERVAKYKELPGQYPHTEIKGQPGYSLLGAEAASVSDLGGSAGEWSEIASPWASAPLHLRSLFDPASTQVWYGEGPSGRTPSGLGLACMGTGGEKREFPEPTFFSAPGNGNSSVPFSETSAEIPFTPAEAAGLPSGSETGPTVVLYPEGVTALPDRARLTGPGGEFVPTQLVTADTPAPPTHGYPWGHTVGSDYVVIPRPLRPSAMYKLEVVWSSATNTFVQHASFSTMSSRAAERRMAWGFSCVALRTCATGALHLELAGDSTTVSGHPATGQPLFVEIRRGRMSCLVHARPCPSDRRFFTADVIKRHQVAFDGSVRIRLPPPTSYGSAVEVRAELGRFEFGGYAWTEAVATIFRR